MFCRNNRAAFACIIGLLICSIVPFSPTSRAQQNPDEESAIGETRTPAELVTDYLKQDVFLFPGVGLRQVRIGMDFTDVRRTWGTPTSAHRSDINGTWWTYQIADHTRITLIGTAKVRTMRIAGAFNSPYVTNEGVSFGMPRHQLATIYGPADSDSDEVIYSNLGIGFVLGDGLVREMRVFPPK